MPSPAEYLVTPPASQVHSSPKFGEPDLREKILERDRQRKLDAAAATRLEKRRVKERLESARGEKARLDSLATIQQAQDLWRLKDEARALKLCEQKKMRDEAGIRAGGAYKRPVASQEATEPGAKRRLVGVNKLVGVDNRHSR